MKFSATIMHSPKKHNLARWKRTFIDDVEAKFVDYCDALTLLSSSPLLWTQINLIDQVWKKDYTIDYNPCSAQVIQSLDDSGFYTYSYLVMSEDGDKLILTKHGQNGFGEVYDIGICYVGKEKWLNDHLAILYFDVKDMFDIKKHY